MIDFHFFIRSTAWKWMGLRFPKGPGPILRFKHGSFQWRHGRQYIYQVYWSLFLHWIEPCLNLRIGPGPWKWIPFHCTLFLRWNLDFMTSYSPFDRKILQCAVCAMPWLIFISSSVLTAWKWMGLRFPKGPGPILRFKHGSIQWRNGRQYSRVADCVRRFSYAQIHHSLLDEASS